MSLPTPGDTTNATPAGEEVGPASICRPDLSSSPLRILSGVLVAMAAIFFMFIFLWQWFGGTPISWPGGTPKAGDLAQHYVAGIMWNEHRSNDLYQNFEFSRRFTQWGETLHIPQKDKRQFGPFNYVYCPLVAKISSLFSRLSFAIWIRSWLVVMFFTTVASWFLLSKTGTGIRPYLLKDWFLLFSFPGIWYTFIPHQNSTITLFLVSAASLFSARGLPFTAGAVLACAFYKPQFIVCIGLIMLAARQYRFIIGLGAGTAVWIALQLQTCGLGLYAAWIQSVRMSLDGKQFQWIGLNQSWRGWLLSFPGLTAYLTGRMDLIISAVLLIAAGLFLRRLERFRSWRPGFDLLFASAVWTVASPYTAHYDFLLILGLWAVCCRYLPNTNANLCLCFLGWIASLASASGAFQFPWITAPLVTLWILLAIKRIADSNRTMNPIMAEQQ